MKKVQLLLVMLLVLLVWPVSEAQAVSTTAAFEGSGDNAGKTLPFEYEFTTSGSDVTLTISNVDGTGISGLVATPDIYDWTSGSQISRGQALTYTWQTVADGTTLKVKLHWAATNGVFWSDELTYTYTSSSTPTLITNLALGKTTKASSNNEINTSDAAVDGNIGTRWESEQGVDPQSWQVDLVSAKTFDAIVIKWEGAYAQSFTISLKHG